MTKPLISPNSLDLNKNNQEKDKIFFVINDTYHKNKLLKISIEDNLVGMYLDKANAYSKAKQYVKDGDNRYISVVIKHNLGDMIEIQNNTTNFSDENKSVIEVFVDGIIINKELYPDYIECLDSGLGIGMPSTPSINKSFRKTPSCAIM